MVWFKILPDTFLRLPTVVRKTCAIKPRTLKTAKPARKLVAQLDVEMIMESLSRYMKHDQVMYNDETEVFEDEFVMNRYIVFKCNPHNMT